MPNINLLPWREKLREARKKQFLRLWVACIIMACMSMSLVHAALAKKIATQKKVNTMFNREIQSLDIQIEAVKNLKVERDNLLSRMRIIQRLQESRPLTVKVFDAMTRIMPDGVYLTNFSRENATLSLKGMAESNTRVSELMRALEESNYFYNAQLNEIKTEKVERADNHEFELQCRQNTGEFAWLNSI